MSATQTYPRPILVGGLAHLDDEGDELALDAEDEATLRLTITAAATGDFMAFDLSPIAASMLGRALSEWSASTSR